MPNDDSIDNFEWFVVYESGHVISQSMIESWDKLPDRQKIISAGILYNNKIHEYLMMPENDTYPFWVHRRTQRGDRIYGMHILAKLKTNTNEPITILFVLDNGQSLITDHWWQDHAYFMEPQPLQEQRENYLKENPANGR